MRRPGCHGCEPHGSALRPAEGEAGRLAPSLAAGLGQRRDLDGAGGALGPAAGSRDERWPAPARGAGVLPEPERPRPAVPRHRQAPVAEVAVGEVAQLQRSSRTPDGQRLGLGRLPLLTQLALALQSAPGDLDRVEPRGPARQQPTPHQLGAQLVPVAAGETAKARPAVGSFLDPEGGAAVIVQRAPAEPALARPLAPERSGETGGVESRCGPHRPFPTARIRTVGCSSQSRAPRVATTAPSSLANASSFATTAGPTLGASRTSSSRNSPSGRGPRACTARTVARKRRSAADRCGGPGKDAIAAMSACQRRHRSAPVRRRGVACFGHGQTSRCPRLKGTQPTSESIRPYPAELAHSETWQKRQPFFGGLLGVDCVVQQGPAYPGELGRLLHRKRLDGSVRQLDIDDRSGGVEQLLATITQYPSSVLGTNPQVSSKSASVCRELPRTAVNSAVGAVGCVIAFKPTWEDSAELCCGPARRSLVAQLAWQGPSGNRFLLDDRGLAPGATKRRMRLPAHPSRTVEARRPHPSGPLARTVLPEPARPRHSAAAQAVPLVLHPRPVVPTLSATSRRATGAGRQA